MLNVRKRFKSMVSILMVAALLCGMVSFGTIAGAVEDYIGGKDYAIQNPYAAVDWNTWGQYKSATHVHTHVSDGSENVDEMIEKYYELGYDGLALTDHGTVNYGWMEPKTRLTIFDYNWFVHANPRGLSQERNFEITTGVGRNARGMIDIPYGIELNAASTAKCHVNSYFADCGHGDLEMDAKWPLSAVQKSAAAGGITHINHVGEWSDAKDNIGVYDSDFTYKFSRIFADYPSCVGMELVNTSDSRTRNDRYLYDEVLKRLSPEGKNVFGFCEDDSHEFGDCGKNAQYFVMPSNTASNVRKSMETGAFFACSKNAKTPDELGDGFSANGNFPSVKRIGIDESKDQITISCADATKVKLVADGTVIATYDVNANGDEITIDLNKYESAINGYVRIYLTGAGGICYVQPFILTASSYKTSTVQFVLPSSDTTVQVKNSAGAVVSAVNSNNYYILSEGNYTYTAARKGFVTKTDVAFSVSSNDIAVGTQKKINIALQEDKLVLSTFFYVPETIYLAPTAGSMNIFQYYADRDNSKDGALTKNAQDVSGNIFFSCEGAKSVTIKVDSVASSATNGAINFKNGYTVNGSSASTQITAGSLSTALYSGGGTVITWSATYTLENGSTYTDYAYSYVYAPQINEVSAAMRHYHTYSTDVYNQGILWSTGFHAVSGGSYNCSKNFFVDSAPTGNTGIDPWFTGASNAGSNYGSYRHKSNASDTHNITGGTGLIMVDSSRITNLNQIPNLKVGFWQCDIQGDGSARGWIKQTADNNTTTLKEVANGVGTVYSASINAANTQGCTGTKSVDFSAYTLTDRGSRKNNNYYNINISATYLTKDVLRTAYNNAIREAYQASLYTADTFNSFMLNLKTAGEVLGNPSATQAQVSSALTALNNSINALVSVA